MQSEPSSPDEPVGLCRCGHTSRTHNALTPNSFCANLGCTCIAFKAQPLPTVVNDRCKCSHDRFRHNWGSENDGACSKPDCDCKAYAPVTVETVELPEPDSGERLDAAMRDLWEASDRGCAEMIRKFAARYGVRQDDFPESKPFEIPSIQTDCAVLHKDAGGNVVPCSDEAPAEPHECDNCEGVDPDSCLTRLPPPEGPEYTPCACGHIEPDHSAFGAPHCLKCECPLYRTEPPCKGCGQMDGYWFDRSVCAEPCSSMHDRCTNCGAVSGHCPLETPPQPERRPPLTVQYSVAGGHPYEVSIPGDASVTAEDGALVIKHPSAEILAITRVAPMEG